MPEERLVYGVGRDVTDSRRAAKEQAALRRVATPVAKGVAPAEIFAAGAREVRALFEAGSACVVRFEPDGSSAVLGSAPDGSGARVVTAGDEQPAGRPRFPRRGAAAARAHDRHARARVPGARGGDGNAPALVAQALEHVRQANEDMRDLSHGILPAALMRGGLRAGVDSLVSRLPLRVATHVSVGRLPSVVEATAYIIVAEALTNISKHARAARAEVGVEMRIDSPNGRGTLIAAEIPLSGHALAKRMLTAEAGERV